MKLRHCHLAFLFSFAAFACSDTPMDGGGLEADSGTGASVDAAPAPPDASPLPDAAPVEPDAGDFPVELACSLDELEPILTCVTDNCLDSIADNTLVTCVTLSCGLLLLTLPPQCSQCLLTGLTDPSSALDSCVLGLDDLGLPPAP